jgi:two-component system NtrC family sensor kinase
VTSCLCSVALLAVVQSWLIARPDIALNVAVATLAGLANLAMLRVTRNPGLAGHLAVAVLTILIAFTAMGSGGFYHPTFAWFYVLPLAAAVMVDLRGAAVWTVFTAALAFGFWLLPGLGIELVDQTPVELRPFHALTTRVLNIIALGVTGAGFVIAQRRAGRELQREHTYLELVMHAAVSANQARSFEEALDDSLKRICDALGWIAGHVLLVAEDGSCASTGDIHSTLPSGTPVLEQSRTRVFARGEGLPGRVVASGAPEIIHPGAAGGPAASQASLERARAARALGIVAGFAVPILVRGRVRAVLEFASARPVPDPGRLIEVLTHIGVQLGRVAERTELQERIRQTQKMEAIGQLAAGLAHEINNPMSFVRSNLHSLREMADPERKDAQDEAEFGELLEECLVGVERTISIVRDVMQFSHSGGAGAAAWQSADVNELLRDSLRVASSDAPGGVLFDVDAGVVPPIRCAPNGLRQVFLNLIVNAVQAVGDAGRVTLRTRHEGDVVVVAVEDDGPGMSAADRERLFDPFFTTKPVGVGTGLGLTISYEIVQSHGGSIRVVSEPGEGALFEVRLPRDAAATAPND